VRGTADSFRREGTMRKHSSRVPVPRATMVGLAVVAAAIATATAFAHTGGSLEGSRYTDVESVLHETVLDGEWTFTVETVTRTVRGLSYIVKSPGCPGTILLEHRIRRQPSVGDEFKVTLGDHDANATANYCSQVIYTGSGSVKVRVRHP